MFGSIIGRMVEHRYLAKWEAKGLSRVLSAFGGDGGIWAYVCSYCEMSNLHIL